MTLTTFDGFENYSAMAQFSQVWNTGSGHSPTFAASGGYNNSRCIQIGANDTGIGAANFYIERTFQPSRTVTTGIAMKFNPIPGIGFNNLNPVIEFRNGTNINISVYLKNMAANNNTGVVPKFYPLFAKSYNFASGTFIATGNVLKNYDITDWHYYELELDCSTTGFARFYVDGNKVLELTNYDFSSVTTAIQTTSAFRTYGAVYTQSQNSATITMVDNFYLTDDTARLGHMTFNTLRPTADTDQRDWVPSTGTANYDIVNDLGSQTVNSVSTSTNDATDLYVMSDLTPSTSVSSILGVKQNMIATKTRLGDTVVSGLLKYGNNTINMPGVLLAENIYNTYQTIMDTNPVTNQRWLPADLNNMQIGMTSHLQTDIILKSINNTFITTVPNTALVTSDTGPSLSNGAAIFGSGNVVRYSDAPGWHITSPWSVEFEFYTSSQNVDQCIFSVGGSATTYPEFNIMINSDNSVTSSANSNNTAGGQQTGTYLAAGQLQMNKWYRIGAMFYTVGGVNRLRGYINGYQKFDIRITLPYDSTKGVSVGNDYDALPAKQFVGGIRNFSVGNSLFWIAYTPAYSNVIFAVSNGLVTNSTSASNKAVIPAPTVTGNALVFNGTTQGLQYTNGPSTDQFNITPPFSIEFDVNQASLTNGGGSGFNQWFFNIGTGYDDGRPSLTIRTDMPGSNIVVGYFTSSADTGTNYTLVSGPTSLSTWYKIGVMIYNDGTNNRIRGYVNGSQVFDNIMATLPKAPGAIGINLGGSDPIHPYTFFNGSIRSLRVGRALFWNI